MKPADAIALIQKGITTDRPQRWADLGCGGGTFTRALFQLLPVGSEITAVDQQKQNLDLPVNFIRADFEKDQLFLTGLDGILMANSLHYVANKTALIAKLEAYFAAAPNFLIVEYDTEHSNPWVPYPVSFIKLQQLFTDSGYNNIVKLGDRPSVYNSARIYAAAISQALLLRY